MVSSEYSFQGIIPYMKPGEWERLPIEVSQVGTTLPEALSTWKLVDLAPLLPNRTRSSTSNNRG
jgi:hypothetical protein